MSNYNTKINFTADKDVAVEFKPARVSKPECLSIGHDYFQADDKGRDAMLETLGGVLVRRSLLIFGNWCRRNGQKPVGDYTLNVLRSEVVIGRKAAAA
jgi:hypothetical protein